MNQESDREPDGDLVRRCRDHDQLDAFDELVDRHQSRLFGTIQWMVRNRELAADLVQESFLRAWRGLSGFKGEAQFYTWLYRIARNLVSSHMRRRTAGPHFVSKARDLECATELEPQTTEGQPMDPMLLEERRLLIISGVKALQPDFKEIIVLCDLEEHSYEEVADLLEIPLGTVRSRLHRARASLKEILERAQVKRD